MDMTNQENARYVARLAKPSPLAKDTVWAFFVGGGICALGQGFIRLYTALGMTKETAGSAASITLVFLSALFTGLNCYDTLAKHAGAGTLVPITGFANSVVAPAMEFKTEGFVTGMAAKMFTIAGPVLVFGVSASVIYGILYYFAAG